MRAGVMPWLAMPALCLATGCGHLLVEDSHVLFDWRLRYGILEAYDKTGALPPDSLSQGAQRYVDSMGTNGVAHLYAVRSACRVRHSPAFGATGSCASLAVEFTTGENGYLGWIPPTLFIPITVALDVIHLPIQAVQTAFVSQQDIEEALVDLEKARAMGYDEDTIPVSMLGPLATHLDRLGFVRANATPVGDSLSTSPQTSPSLGQQADTP